LGRIDQKEWIVRVTRAGLGYDPNQVIMERNRSTLGIYRRIKTRKIPSNCAIVIGNRRATKVRQCVSVTDLDNSSKDPNPGGCFWPITWASK
jgi:hypothetical protein